MNNEAPKFAIVLSGCGVFDGSEIHEAVCTMLAVDQSGCTYQCFGSQLPGRPGPLDHFTRHMRSDSRPMKITATYWRNRRV